MKDIYTYIGQKDSNLYYCHTYYEKSYENDNIDISLITLLLKNNILKDDDSLFVFQMNFYTCIIKVILIKRNSRNEYYYTSEEFKDTFDNLYQNLNSINNHFLVYENGFLNISYDRNHLSDVRQYVFNFSRVLFFDIIDIYGNRKLTDKIEDYNRYSMEVFKKRCLFEIEDNVSYCLLYQGEETYLPETEYVKINAFDCTNVIKMNVFISLYASKIKKVKWGDLTYYYCHFYQTDDEIKSICVSSTENDYEIFLK